MTLKEKDVFAICRNILSLAHSVSEYKKRSYIVKAATVYFWQTRLSQWQPHCCAAATFYSAKSMVLPGLPLMAVLVGKD